MGQIPIEYALRPCPICDGDDFEPLEEREEKVETRAGGCLFRVREGICRLCGCVYANPAPTQSSLDGYYAAKHLHCVGAPDFDMANRVRLLQDVARHRRRLLEVGAGEGSFVRRTLELGFDSSGEDLNLEARAMLPRGSEGEGWEIVVGNHVLEHLANPLSFVKDIAARLAEGGLLILEVPNLHVYARQTSAIMCEHLTHFSPGLLAHLLQRAGLRSMCVEMRRVSRPIGFVLCASNEKGHGGGGEVVPREYLVNRAYFSAGLELRREVLRNRRELLEDTLRAGGSIVLWGANAFMIELVAQMDSAAFSRLRVVDANPKRWGEILKHHADVAIADPATLGGPSERDRAIICAVDWQAEIRESLQRLGFASHQIKVVPF